MSKAIAELDEIIAFVSSSITTTTSTPPTTTATPKQQQPKQQKQQQQKKAPVAPKPVKSSNPDIALFQYAQIQVVRIIEAEKHPQADSLFLLKVDAGNNDTRTVVAGLWKYYKPDELQNRLVCSILNLKPAKLAGIESQAMLLAGSDGKDIVKLLAPPEGSEPGDRVYLRGEESSILEETERCPPKQWQRIVPKLKAKNGKAAYDNWDLVTSKGDVTVDLPDNSEIH
jgi:methionine--tRNA ligase beta chain